MKLKRRSHSVRTGVHARPIAQSDPRSPVTEAYKTIRTNIQFAGVVQETKVILVTSSQPGEGKTTTTANLAVVSAQAGNSVLLIDADMRKPQLHQRFRISNLDGLSTVLIRERSLSECVVASQTPGLYLLPSGPIPPNPSEILASKTFEELLEQCRDQFDMIFIDSPPVLAVTDPLVLSRVCDGTILVVSAQTTNRNLAVKSVNMLRQVNARLLGTVLNRVEQKSSGSYYYYYQQTTSVKA